MSTEPVVELDVVVEAEVVVETEAQKLDAELRSEVRTFVRSLDRLFPLIHMARMDRIHEELGFASWTAYIVDVIAGEMRWFNVDTRRAAVRFLAGEGMSQRAIAEAVGVSQKTVDRDLDKLSHDDSVGLPDKVTGLDGKERPAHPVQPKPAPKPEPTPAPPKPQPTAAVTPYTAEEDWEALAISLHKMLGERTTQAIQAGRNISLTRDEAVALLRYIELEIPESDRFPYPTGDAKR